MRPLVSVILPVYNAECTVLETIQSIIDQTYKNWELIIINDGSTDNSVNIIKSFHDDRIKYFANEGNKKLIYTLNRGLNLASGKYIARMDADDICKRERFEKQVNYLENHPKVIVCGTQIEYFGNKSSNFRKLIFPLKDRELKDMLALSTCFAHPSVMIRRSVLEDSGIAYNYDFINAEDYCLWIDLSRYGKFANLNERLLMYRISDTQVSQPSNPLTMKSVLACKKRYLKMFLDANIVEELFEKPIDISLLVKIKHLTNNKRVWEGCYLSLSCYNCQSFLYYILSLDVFKLGLKTFLRFSKRYILGKDPIYSQLQ